MISVAIQGGAMRSIYCVGAIRALIEAGYSHKIKSVHSSSAGCVSAAILANHITDRCAPDVVGVRDQLLDKLAGSRFINSMRLGRIVDVDYLVETMREITSLSVRTLAERKIVFEVGLTRADSGRAEYLDISRCATDADVVTALRATMAIPVLYPKKVHISGVRYLDGGISDPLPVVRALTRGPKALFAITSVPEGELAETLDKGLEYNVIKWIPGIPSHVRSLMLAMNPLADSVDNLISLDSFSDVRIIRISPSDPSLIGSRLEIDKGRLRKLEDLGYRDGLTALATLEMDGELIV